MPYLIAALLGVFMAFTLPPYPSIFSIIGMALLLHHVSTLSNRSFILAIFWFSLVFHAVQLWWLVDFMVQLMGSYAAGSLSFLLFGLEAVYYTAMAFVVARITYTPLGRIWSLAGAWVILESLRFLGPFSFPWPTLGYSLLDSPFIQIADLGGVLLGSAFIMILAALLASWKHIGRYLTFSLSSILMIIAFLYGTQQLSREETGLFKAVQVVRTDIDVFSKAVGITPQLLLDQYMSPVKPSRAPLILPETAVYTQLLSQLPQGIYGVYDRGINGVTAWNNIQEGVSLKAKPVPFGEFFPLKEELAPLWNIIERNIGFHLSSTPPATTINPLLLQGVSYGAYVCYDSVFPWVARQLSYKGADVLVNVSNDGWYTGWGVQQHFDMGRVRAIENRRWLLRSVNRGIAGSIDSKGRSVQLLRDGNQSAVVAFVPQQNTTLYQIVGDVPAVLIALCCLLWGMSRKDFDVEE